MARIVVHGAGRPPAGHGRRASRRSDYDDGRLRSDHGAPAVTYIITEPCIDLKDKSCVDVCPVDCIHEVDRMLVIDPEECIDCGACEPECPVEAIFPEDAVPDAMDPFIRINYAFTDGLATVNDLVAKQIE